MGESCNLISIIVPVYNVADYLRRGIDSILSQSFQDFELILVDDGSKDDSGVICDDYAAKNARIQVIHKENGGVSSARNVGLEMARGKWIYFMDPDDELYPDSLATLVDGISEDVDTVMGGYEEYRMNGTLLRTINPSLETTFLDKSNSLRPLFAPYSPEFGYVGHAWLRLYRMSVIRENMIRFDESIAIREGTLFNVAYLCLSRGTTLYIPKPIYRYYHRETSAVWSLSKSFNRTYLSSFDANVKMLRLVKQTKSVDTEVVKAAKFEVIDRYKKIRRKMYAMGVEDENLFRALKQKCVKELGLFFVMSYYIVSRIGRWKKKVA